MAEAPRLFLIVLDGVGVGELPDAHEWGDVGANTFVHVAEHGGPLAVPNLCALGLGNIAAAPGVEPSATPRAAWGRMAEQAQGKDTTAGHWEIAGVILEKRFPVFPDGFPAELMSTFEARIGRSTLGNRAASGTAILEELGESHVATGKPIVYTSADSVFQIAAHEQVIPIDELYRQCEIARELLTGDLAVARVIARPFEGSPGAWKRTARRHDYSLEPPGTTVLDQIAAAGLEVHGIGKIHDIYCGRGITRSTRSADNGEGMALFLEAQNHLEHGAVFVNLNDFDSLWGHRNDPESFARGLEEFDRALPAMLSRLRPSDLFLITADHGNDPTTPGTDHCREYVPILAIGPGIEAGAELGVRGTFADVAATMAVHLGVDWDGPGTPLQTGNR